MGKGSIMQKTLWRALGCCAALAAIAAGLASCASVPTESAEAALQRANTAMGGTALRSIFFAAAARVPPLARLTSRAWPGRRSLTPVLRIADYENAAFREDAARSRAEPNGGGAVPLMGMGEQRTTGLMRAASAWNLAVSAPRP